MIEDPDEGWVRGQKHSGRVTFGVIGRLVPHKRHGDVLQALRHLCDDGYDAALVIAGDGPLREALAALATQLGIADRVTFTGEFERLEDVMAKFDVFVLTSSSESQCMPITESMAYGKPVVGSDFGGIPDFVEDGVTGFLVPVGDVPKLVSALKTFLDNPSLREEMGKRGREHYVARYTPQSITQAMEQVYNGLWAQRPVAGLHLGYVVECYATFIVKEILELRRLGAQVTVFNAFRPLPEQDPIKEALRQDSLYFPPRYRGVVAANLGCLLRKPLVYMKWATFFRRHNESLGLLALAAYYARWGRQHGIQHLHGTFGTRTTTLAHATAQLAGIDYSFTTHAYDIFKPNPLLVWNTNHARFMRTISAFNRSYIIGHYAGIDPQKVCVIYLGVDTCEFAPNKSEAVQSPTIRMVSVGHYIPQKGHSYLIRACQHLRDRGLPFECTIIGGGPLQEQFQEEIEACGLTGIVRLLDEQPHDVVQRYLSEAHIFALPCFDARDIGQHIDGLPVALMEAMAMGLATVSTNISGIPELIEDGVSGLLVPQKDAVAVADALTKLILDESLRLKLGCAARQRIEERFDLSTNTYRLATVFEELLG
jgi:glycosyltransferase involved in cell wall biosynthesis